MTLRAEERKIELVEGVCGLVRQRLNGDGKDGVAAHFARCFYAHVPPEDVLNRDPADLCGAALSLWRFAGQRPPGEAKIRVFNPDPATDGWSSACTVVEIVNDDMPFLVDSVTAALNGRGLVVHLVIHPILPVERDAAGTLVAVDAEPPAAAGGAGGAPVAAAAALRARRESLMHVEIARQTDPAAMAALADALAGVLADVRAAVQDWPKMRAQLAATIYDLTANPPPLDPAETAEVLSFMKWLDDDNFTFLGYREYKFDETGGEGGSGALTVVPNRGLGILRNDEYSVFDGLRNFGTLPPDVQDFMRRKRQLLITKSNRRATVHRPAHMDAIVIKTFDAVGRVDGERLFLGLFTSLAYSRSARSIPMLRRKVEQVLARSGFSPSSHDGKALQHILDTFPRDELFQAGDDEIFDIAIGILNLQDRQRIALFLRRDPFERFVSAFVYVPRDRFNTDLRQRMAKILENAFDGEVENFQIQLDESPLARVHFVIRTRRGAIPPVEFAELEAQLVEAGRTWADRLREALIAAKGDAAATPLLHRYAEAFPTAYRESASVAEALADIDLVETVLTEGDRALAMRLVPSATGGAISFRLCRAEAPVALSDILPMLEAMGFRVISEIPYRLAPADAPPVSLQDFALSAPAGAALGDAAGLRARVEEAFAAVWSGAAESDGFNRLVLLARLGWRQVTVLRAYAKVLRQAGSSFSQAYMEDALAAHPEIAARLVDLFERRFDPTLQADAEIRVAGLLQEIDHRLDAVTSLDEDRILRSFLLLIQKTLRTNYYLHQRGGAVDGQPKPYLALKLASREIELLPAPRPLVEIYVYSPRVEGVHLRGGKVARGGIRWSDRKEDVRTEILGLMKAQMVKNAVIVPVGSKGGFVVKRPPPLSAGREAQLAEGIECYKTLVRGLLDLTDNIVGDSVVPPPDVVRHDGDDPYLVVAADKGTATFSDIANGVSAEYGFWLGDAFASGGSAGYDHKAMGITARGAWELVKRHFREIGVDIQTTGFTVVGVGDMSGDVFGNGMLLSKHIKLLGAFDHRHIFVDPDPADPAKSWKERKRLFGLPRSSWADYDPKVISAGGGVFERSAKSIALSAEIRARFGISAERVTPADLMRAILTAEADLLWFGGIGTYVKATNESNAEAGDRANDALRISGAEIRAKVVGEGANLGVTQRGRIEYALKGGRINTDAIDNSAGVDTSDHEVNIKIPLNGLVASGALTIEERNATLAAMTDEVAQLVLQDNYLQGQTLSLAQTREAELVDQLWRLIRTLERAGRLDRGLEFLPDDETLAARAAQRQGLTRPELAVLLAYVKNTLYADLLPTDLPDEPQLAGDLTRYFPKPMVKRFRAAIEGHRLRREIIATFVTNSLVNRAGITFVHEMVERSGRGPADVARAYAIARDAFALRPLWTAIDALDNKVPATVQYGMHLAAVRLVERTTVWLLRSGLPLDIGARVEAFAPGIATLDTDLPDILPEAERATLAAAASTLAGQGVPTPLAGRVARLPWLASAVDVIRLAEPAGRDPADVGRVYYAVGGRFGLDRLRRAAASLKAETPWQKLAAAALVDEFYALQSTLAAGVLAAADAAPLDAWSAARRGEIASVEAMIAELVAAPDLDLAMLTVAARRLRALAEAAG